MHWLWWPALRPSSYQAASPGHWQSGQLCEILLPMAGVSHCKGFCLPFHRENSFKGYFCFGVPLGNIKGENKGNSEPLLFCHRPLVDNLSSEVPVKRRSASLQAQCSSWNWRQSPKAASSIRTRWKKVPSQGQKGTLLRAKLRIVSKVPQ